MLKQQMMTCSQKYTQLPLWKRMTLVTAILFSGSSLAALVPSQAAFAHSSKPNTSHHTGHKGQSTRTKTIKLLIVCKAGNGGRGGSATKKSNGASGGSGGSCIVSIPIKQVVTIKTNSHHK